MYAAAHVSQAGQAQNLSRVSSLVVENTPASIYRPSTGVPHFTQCDIALTKTASFRLRPDTPVAHPLP